MQFIDRKRTRPVIPLVSLIDILTILLIFFIVAAEFRQEQHKETAAAERRLDISLPGVSEIEGNPVNDNRTTISLAADGAIRVGGQAVENPAALVAVLGDVRAADPAAKFELVPDENVPLGILVGVWDSLVKAGIPVAEVPARVLKRP